MAKKPNIGWGPIGDDLAKALRKAARSKNAAKKEQVKRVRGKISDRQAQTAKKKALSAAQRQLEQKAANKKIIRSADKMMNKADLQELRGAGKPVKSRRTGKPVSLPKKAQGAARSQAGGIRGGMAKTNASRKAKLDAITARMKDKSATPQDRAKARREAMEFKKKYGF